ncbi:hypothetical protein CYY_004121 [Polysphondylium violaceum]|uniref:Amidohydrolase-related domain-containing protein n=1 Tax=Polysphondylium violaceum TaxID=133409 RepID=A0A8J4PVR8_9MYCE|nr:hypothetical protein CYY_004121 [Polysphondylium violaceum]
MINNNTTCDNNPNCCGDKPATLTKSTSTSCLLDADFAVVAKWIIPVVPENTVYENHCIVVKKEKILDIVKYSDLEMRYNVKNVINLKEMNTDSNKDPNVEYILTPGFFNMHAHSAMTLLRGYADDVSLHDWLNKFIWPAEAQYVGEEFVELGTQLACMEMIKTGTTYCNEMYYFPEVSAKVIQESGMRATVAAPIIKFPTCYAANEDEYIEKGIKLIESYAGNEKIKISLGPHAVYTITDEAYKKVKELSEKYKLPIHTHLHETHIEVNGEIEASGKRPIQRLKELEVLSPSLIAAHMTQLDSNDINLVADHGVHVVHCPESNLKLGVSGVAPIHKLLSREVNVSLGTDSAASNDDLDILGELRTAAYVDKLSYNSSTEKLSNHVCTPSYKVLSMATINGAKALGVDDKLGSLELGKMADFIAVKINSFPVYDPISHLVYVGTNKVSDVWVSGKQLLKNGKCTTINETALNSKVIEFTSKINSTRPNTKLKVIQ